MAYALYNTGINCMPNDTELDKLFGNRGSLFLKEVPARLMSQRGYGNMPCPYPIKPSDDKNIKYPEYKLHTGVFDCIKSDFPKGPGGVSPNPMWADGTYDEMKANFIRQGDEQNDVRHLIPELEDLRLKEYELSQFTGGTAQQNKVEFMLKESMNAEQHLKDQQKVETILKEFPMLSREKANEYVIKSNVDERIRLLNKRGANLSDMLGVEVVNVIREGHPNQAQDEARAGIRPGAQTERSRAEEAHLARGGTQATMPKPKGTPAGMAGYEYAWNIGNTEYYKQLPSRELKEGQATLPPLGSITNPVDRFPHFKDTSRSVASAPSRPYDESGLGRRLDEERRAREGYELTQARKALLPEGRIPKRGVRMGRTTFERFNPGAMPGLGTMAVPSPIRGLGQGSGGGGRIPTAHLTDAQRISGGLIRPPPLTDAQRIRLRREDMAGGR